MKITIKQKNENKLIGRLEVSGDIIFDAQTPSNTVIITALAKELKTEESLIVMRFIHTKFSEKRAEFSAVAYSNNESKVKYEMMTKHLRKKAEEETKKLADEVVAKAEEEKKKAEEAKAAAEQAKETPVEASEKKTEEPATAE